jgi:hypothetical protein
MAFMGVRVRAGGISACLWHLFLLSAYVPAYRCACLYGSLVSREAPRGDLAAFLFGCAATM